MCVCVCVCVCVFVQNEVEVPNLVVKHAKLEERMRDADQLLKKGDTARANKVSFTVYYTNTPFLSLLHLHNSLYNEHYHRLWHYSAHTNFIVTTLEYSK